MCSIKYEVLNITDKKQAASLVPTRPSSIVEQPTVTNTIDFHLNTVTPLIDLRDISH